MRIFPYLYRGECIRKDMSQYIGTPPIPTADTRLVITKGKDTGNKPTYELRLFGRWEWDSILIGAIGKGITNGSMIYGVATSRIDLWKTPSKMKTSIKTLQDFSDLTNTHFFSNDEGVLFIGSLHYAKPILKASDSYENSIRAEDLTLIC